MRSCRFLHALAVAGLISSSSLGDAAAQPAPPAPGAPAAPAPPASAPVAGQLGPGEEAAEKARPDRLKEALAPRAGGLTPQVVASMAVQHSPQVAVTDANREAASGQVVQTIVQYVPRLTLTAQYQRLSEVNQGTIGGGGASLGALNEGPVTVGPCPTDPAIQCVLDAGGLPVQAVSSSFEFPQILNQYTLNANINVPISDYFLRAVQAYQAASNAEEALELSANAQRLQTAADAKVAYFQWIQARGQTAVTTMSVEQANAQVEDAKVGLAAGTLARADLMRVEAGLAQAQFTEAEARAVEATAEARLRTLTGLPADRVVEVGIDVFATPSAPTLAPTGDLIAEASRNRLDLQSARAAEEGRDDAENVTSAGYLPRVDAFADLTYANPNQRIVPSAERWDGTWALGVRATWVVNETFSTLGAARAARAQTAAATAQRRGIEDAIRIEVTSARADLEKSAPQLEAASRGLAAAEESYRVTKQLFAYGKSTAVALTDAEVALTNARLRKVAAHTNLLAAIVRLEHAVGRDRVRTAR